MKNKGKRSLAHRYPDIEGKDLKLLQNRLEKIKKSNEELRTKQPNNFCNILDYKTLNDERPGAGVWAIFGKKTDSKIWKCLQVCETSNITREIVNDIGLIQGDISFDKRVPYINQSGKRVFFHPVHFHNPAKWALIDIRYNYSQIAVILIALEDNIKERRKIEELFATRQKALYWRASHRPQGSKNIC